MKYLQLVSIWALTDRRKCISHVSFGPDCIVIAFSAGLQDAISWVMTLYNDIEQIQIILASNIHPPPKKKKKSTRRKRQQPKTLSVVKWHIQPHCHVSIRLSGAPGQLASKAIQASWRVLTVHQQLPWQNWVKMTCTIAKQSFFVCFFALLK